MPSPSPVPAPALLVVGGRRRGATPRNEPGADSPWLRKLTAALPPAASVLALGELPAGLREQCRSSHPGARWQTVCATPAALSDLAATLAPGSRFDLVVCPDLGALADPLAVLRSLVDCCEEQARLLTTLRNGATLEALESLIAGDSSQPADTEPCSGPLAQASPSAIYKLLMDAGWMPHLADHTRARAVTASLAAATAQVADSLQVPRATALSTLSLDRLVIDARLCFNEAPEPQPASAAAGAFSVVVPTTREQQLRLNVELSPGLAEVDARIISSRGAASPAEALQNALAHCDTDWVLLCHQDVYFPQGFGHRLQALLAKIPATERPTTLIGFVGMAINEARDGYAPAGFVIDRLHRADHPASEQAVSLDELAIVVSRDSVHRIDPALGWHLWATDLCLQAICSHKVFPRIVRLPLFHNSLNDYRLPPAFGRAARQLVDKHPAFGPIPTLCGTLDAAWFSQPENAAP